MSAEATAESSKRSRSGSVVSPIDSPHKRPALNLESRIDEEANFNFPTPDERFSHPGSRHASGEYGTGVPGEAAMNLAIGPEEAAMNVTPTKRGHDDKKGKRQKGKGREYKGKDRRGPDSDGWTKSKKVELRKERDRKDIKDGPVAVGTDEGGKEAGDEDEEDDDKGEGHRRLPKKKCAILLGYCGSGYSGMQIQPHGSKTIEGDFFEALVKAGAVSAENSVDHRKVDVQRAARTDSGVHAAGNCISMKMILEPPLPAEHDTLASYVNSFLPEQIRMWGFVRTVKSFQARMSCDSRIYEYVLPSYCLLPPSSSDALAKRLDASSPGWRESIGSAAEFSDAGIPFAVLESEQSSSGNQGEEDAAPAQSEDDKMDVDMDDLHAHEKNSETAIRKRQFRMDNRSRGEFERRRGWRVDQDTLSRFKALIAQYTGTHNFHNYTVGKPFNDRTVKRYMIRLAVREPQVVGDIEWISVQIHGQSFMLHQIRKMLSMAILACRTGSPPSLIPETYGPKRIHIPKAPPLGLLLEAPQFGTYNSRLKSKGPGGLDSERDPIDWSMYEDEIQAFRLKHIYEKLRQDELESHVFHKWLRQMDCTSSGMLSFLNTQGVIPADAQISGGRTSTDNKATVDEKDLESEDEDLNQELLRRGELEG